MNNKTAPRKSRYILGKSARFISLRLVEPVAKTGISPNYITLLSLVFCIASAFLFSLGHASGNYIGIVCFALFFILDHLDGDLARYIGKESILGDLFDSITGKVGHIVIYLGICIGQSKLYKPSLVWFLGFVIISGFFAFQSLIFKRKIIRITKAKPNEKSDTTRPKQKRMNPIKIFLNELTAGYMVISYLIILGGIFNAMYYALILTAIYVWLYYFLEIASTANELSKIKE